MSNYKLFSVIGLEIEYMLVHQQTLAISPVSDLLIHALAKKPSNEAVLDDIVISNELVMHVLELKNNGPKPVSPELVSHFQNAILKLQPLLNKHQLCLLPTAAHPFMHPEQETKRWPHDNNDIYAAYDRIFNCQGHGWANLQSMHVNLPFADDAEFNYLHNAIRMLLPLLPALAASSPILDEKPTGLLDTRLQFYNTNQARFPEIGGDIIPDFINSQAEYERRILEPMYKAIRPFDPDHFLQYEWLNSRGAIPKFDYHAIEIRLLDTQECVHADLAIAFVIFEILKSWQAQSERFLTHPIGTAPLKSLYLQTLKTGLDTPIQTKTLLEHWQIPSSIQTCRGAWAALIEHHAPALDQTSQQHLELILKHGNLSERILKAVGKDPKHKQLIHVYRQLAECLLKNQAFVSGTH